MEYKYASNENYEDLASGRVLYHMGGEPTFPVRLTLELYERCRQYSEKKTEIILYDCCCGGAYMLTILGLLKNNTISTIYGSDIDPKRIKLAEDNLRLLTISGMEHRKMELQTLSNTYGKASHRDALQSAERLSQLIVKDIKTQVFFRNVFEAYQPPFIPDIIITDVPYGNMAEWNGGHGGVNQMMDALYDICSKDTILCICMDKKQKITTDRFERLERQSIGKRKFEIYRKMINNGVKKKGNYEGNPDTLTNG